jgi:hypothetical protein
VPRSIVGIANRIGFKRSYEEYGCGFTSSKQITERDQNNLVSALQHQPRGKDDLHHVFEVGQKMGMFSVLDYTNRQPSGNGCSHAHEQFPFVKRPDENQPEHK